MNVRIKVMKKREKKRKKRVRMTKGVNEKKGQGEREDGKRKKR